MVNYAWGHLKQTEDRGKILFNAIKPYLKSGDKFLDINCGFSPMAKCVLESGYSILGFDINSIPIMYLKKNFVQGEWHDIKDEKANFKGYAVFLLLGITTPLYSVYSETLLTSLKRLLTLNRPRLVMAESADAADQRYYRDTCSILQEFGYVQKVVRPYNARLTEATLRHYSIWEKGWDFNYWRSLFLNADDLDVAHEKFYLAAEIKLAALTLYDHGKIVLPTLLKTKDEFVKNLILSKEKIKSMLVVGFWDARFAFHMGLMGFNVDGIECYKKSVEMAKKSQRTLPDNIAKRFNFNLGVAENLSNYPQYDVIVDFCLEHVKNPKQVMEESLKHLMPGGYAYFTPPVERSCDSPTHLHHFQEDDLLALLPKGFQAKIFRVKFQQSSSYPNCFVMEVHKNGGNTK